MTFIAIWRRLKLFYKSLVMSGYWIDVSIKIYENQCISSIKYKDKVTILLNIKKNNNPQFRHSLLCLFNSTFSGQDRQEPRLAKSLAWRSGNASPERDIAAFQVNTQYNTVCVTEIKCIDGLCNFNFMPKH
jgi:hypothetical protein